MKKRKLKRWVKNLIIITILFLIGFGCILAMVGRVDQINRSMGYEETN